MIKKSKSNNITRKEFWDWTYHHSFRVDKKQFEKDLKLMWKTVGNKLFKYDQKD